MMFFLRLRPQIMTLHVGNIGPIRLVHQFELD